jgi:hypothetical protein
MKAFISNIQRRPRVPRQASQWKRLVPFVAFLFSSFDDRARKAVLGIVWHALLRAPYMVPRVIGVILRQYGYAVRPKLREAIREQMELERSGALRLELENPDDLVSDSFRDYYPTIFPQVYQEVVKNLVDPSLTEEMLIEIFTKFLSHPRPGVASFADVQTEELLKQAKMLVAEKNRSLRVGNELRSSDPVLPTSERLHLSTQILKAVEQELPVSEN